MRDYSVITPAFWIGETGKKLRGDGNAQLLAMYLMTSPHSTMTGVFHCPILYMAHETGIPIEGATKALARLLEVGFCEYEESSETVFVVRMASFQIADALKPNDNRIIGLKKEVAKMASALMRSRFLAIYSVAFCLVSEVLNTTPAIAPPKPLRSQEQEQEQEQKQEQGIPSVAKATGGKPPMTTDEIIFGYGVPLLVNAGSTDKASRSFLGGLRKVHGDDALVGALRNCLREKPLQPLEWLAAALPPNGGNPKPNKQEALEASNNAIAARFLERMTHAPQ
jgi:hypothetical protein